MGNYFKMNAISEIIKTIKNNPGISYDSLLIKLQVNEPYLREATAKQLLYNLIQDGQIIVDGTGSVKKCS